MALDWLPSAVDRPQRLHRARPDGTVAPFTAITIPVPDVLASLTFLPSAIEPIQHRHHPRARTNIQEPYSLQVVSPVSWLPTVIAPARHRHTARSEYAAPAYPATLWVPAQGLTWALLPSPHTHHRWVARSEIVETIVPSLINTAAALGCLEIAGGDLTVTAFVQESVTVTDFVQESLASTTLIDGEFC